MNIHWYAGAANALRAYGEKLHEMMDPGFIEIANEGVDYDYMLTPTVPIPAFEAGREVPAGLPQRR